MADLRCPDCGDWVEFDDSPLQIWRCQSCPYAETSELHQQRHADERPDLFPPENNPAQIVEGTFRMDDLLAQRDFGTRT